MIKYSKDGRCKFNSENHSYFIGELKLMGVTTYISKYKQKFDSEKVAEMFAKKNGLIKEDVLAKWKAEGDVSKKNGIACHLVIENYIETRKIELPGISQKEKVAVKFIEDYFISGKLIPVECEVVVYNEHIGLASQIDCIAKNNKNELFILDWKTNKKIETNGWNKYMQEPFGLYPDANFYHYSLQLSLYKKLCSEYEIKDCFIVHFDIEDYKIIRPDKIKLPFYQ